MSKKIKVKSSNLEFVEYIADKKELRIWFLSEKNIIYAYADVPQEIYDELIKASSVGGFFGVNIKYKYKFEKIEDVCDEFVYRKSQVLECFKNLLKEWLGRGGSIDNSSFDRVPVKDIFIEAEKLGLAMELESLCQKVK